MMKFLAIVFAVLMMFPGIVVTKQITITQDCFVRDSSNFKTSSKVMNGSNPLIIKKGEVLNVEDVYGDYIKLTNGKLTGWVYSKLVTKNTNGTYTASNVGCSVNSKPKKSPIGTFSAKSQLKFVDIKITWIKTKVGWIYAGYATELK